MSCFFLPSFSPGPCWRPRHRDGERCFALSPLQQWPSPWSPQRFGCRTTTLGTPGFDGDVGPQLARLFAETDCSR